jgi:hypothetical protein
MRSEHCLLHSEKPPGADPYVRMVWEVPRSNPRPYPDTWAVVSGPSQAARHARDCSVSWVLD